MKFRRFVFFVLSILLLAGCGQEEPTVPPTEVVEVAVEATAVPQPTEAPDPTAVPQSTAVPTQAPSPTEPVKVAYEPTFEAAPCPFALPPDQIEGETTICGHVNVPEDRSNPENGTIRLAVVIFKAESENPQPDPIILLSGGPGEKTVANALTVALVLQSFRDNRDLIVFDQRGVGHSEPALECPEFTQVLFDSLNELDSEVALRTQFEAILACRDRLVAEGHNLSAYNTAENATDVDDIRQALGYEQLNLYGGSYGTLLAQTVMRNHPEGIRSVVLGAVLPAEKSLFVHIPTTIVDATLHFLDACANDEACDNAYPNLKQTLYDTIDQLNAEPVPITITSPLDGQSYDTWLTGDGVFGNLVLFLYITDIIPVLPQAIDDVANGDYELMTQLSSTSLMMFDALSRGMEFSVLCAEDLIGVTPEEFMETRLEMPPQLLGSADPEDIIEYSFFGICENWPVEEADPAVKQPVVSDLPTLILEGEFDPVTPLVYAQEVAEHLGNSYLYEFPGVGHNVLLASSCARHISDQFFDNPNSEPDAGCIADMPGVVFDLPQAEAEAITFEPFTNEEIGVSGVAPASWDKPAPSTFVRGENALDSTALIVDVLQMNHEDFLELITAQLMLEEAPESVGERLSESFVWTLYSVEVQGVAVDIATANQDADSTILVLLQCSPDAREELYEGVFLTAVDELKLIE